MKPKSIRKAIKKITAPYTRFEEGTLFFLDNDDGLTYCGLYVSEVKRGKPTVVNFVLCEDETLDFIETETLLDTWTRGQLEGYVRCEDQTIINAIKVMLV